MTLQDVMYKNGERFQKVNIVKDSNVKQPAQNGNSEGFSFHAKGSESPDVETLIFQNSNSQSPNPSVSPSGDFKYYANEDVEYSVETNGRVSGVRSRQSPVDGNCVNKNRKQSISNSSRKENVQSSKTISLSSLQQLKPPTRPAITKTIDLSPKRNNIGIAPEEESKTIKGSVSRTPSPAKQTHQQAKQPTIRTPSPEKGILKKAGSPTKQKENDVKIEQNDTTQTTDLKRSNEKPSTHKQKTTRLPPAERNHSLVGNGDVNHGRLPPPNKTNGIANKQSGDNSTSTKKIESYKRPPEKRLSPVTKNEVRANQSPKKQVPESNGEPEKMSVSSKSSDRTKQTNTEIRILSPKTDTTEYRTANPRKDNRIAMTPRTEQSYDSRTSSEARRRSKEFTFRWNAPSGNTSPETTDKSKSPPLKQYKPSARIQSFYAYLNGRSKKRKSVQNTPSKPKTILVKKNSQEQERPQSFVFLRSKTVQRSAWDTNPVELTYKPSTNGPEEISLAYVGEHSIREAEMAARLQQEQQGNSPKGKENKGMNRQYKVPPWYEHEYVLNRRQAGVYRNMSQAYGGESKKQRERRFVQKLADYEVYKAKQQWEELLEREKKKKESKDRQILQLNELRQRFEDEAYHRFHTQYVTSRVLEHEIMNRDEFGLPEAAADEPENKPIIKRKKVLPKSLITDDMIQDIYKKKFNKIFDVNTGNGLGRRPKTPKMEGIDTVVLEVHDKKEIIDDRQQSQDAGKTHEKKRMVKDVIKAAEKQLKVNKEERKKLATPQPEKSQNETKEIPMNDIELDDDSDDDDMNDIFEKARRKYDLDIYD